MKIEASIVFGILLLIITLPVITVLVVAESGMSVISDTLASINPLTHMVEVHDPNGNITAQIQATTTWPVTGYVSEEFGTPHMPYQRTHTGIDVAGLTGDPVTPFMSGKIVDAGSLTTGCGLCVVIDHGNNITSRYFHLSRISTSPGQSVGPGDIIGFRGSTGVSTGPHLHFEIRVSNIPINPRIFMIGSPK